MEFEAALMMSHCFQNDSLPWQRIPLSPPIWREACSHKQFVRGLVQADHCESATLDNSCLPPIPDS